jgi:predicted ATPase
VTLTGAGGSGKTRLAQKAAGELAFLMEGGVFFVELAPLTDSRLVVPTICEAASVPVAANQDPRRALVEAWSDPGRPRTLLVLDNFEHLLEAAPSVAALLQACPALTVIATSREVLRLYGEREYPVLPLPTPPDQPLTPEMLGQFPAVELFVERARAVLPAFRLEEGNAAAVAEVCRQLDGLPLALELCAARIKLLSPEAMRGRLANRLELAAGALRDRPLRQQTLVASMEWSHDLLAPAEQVLFRRLGVFAGGFTLEAAEAVANAREDLGLAVADGVASLLDKSLLQRVENGEGQPPRFRMLETVRELARRRLAASEDERITRKAQAAWCLVLAEEFDTRKVRQSDDSRLALLDPEIDNVRAAQVWLLQAGEVEWSLRLAAALLNYHTLRDSVAEGRSRLAAVLAATTRDTDPRLLSRVLFTASWFAMEQGDRKEAQARAREAYEVAVDWAGKVSALVGQASIAQQSGDLEASRAFYDEAIALCRGSGQPETAAQPMLNLAHLARLEGRTAEARELLAECQRLFEAGGNEGGLAVALSQLADVARDDGDADGARALCERSLAILRRIGHHREAGNRLGELGLLDLERGDFTAAFERFREALRIFHRLRAKRQLARALDWMAFLAARQGKPDRCLLLAGAAAAWHSSSGIKMAEAERLELDTAIRQSRETLAQRAGPAWMDGWSVAAERVAEWALEAPDVG